MTSYGEGDLFAVPLRDGGYAVGLAARTDGKGIVVGYFFGQRFDIPPEAGEVDPSDVVWISMFGDLGLVKREWPVIGRLPGWRREDWPMPVFGRRESLTDRVLRVEYPDDEPNAVPRETRITEEEVAELPEDGLAGAGFVEKRMTRLLGGG